MIPNSEITVIANTNNRRGNRYRSDNNSSNGSLDIPRRLVRALPSVNGPAIPPDREAPASQK
jgi:hypothetical protein